MDKSFPIFGDFTFPFFEDAKLPITNGRNLVLTGLVCGVADLCLAVGRCGYHALYIEMKRDGTYQRPSQKQWEAGITKHGNKYVVCRSKDEFSKIVDEYLQD